MATKDSEKNTTNPGSVHVIEYYLENGLFSLRWLLVPLYVGLGLLLILFSVYFFPSSCISSQVRSRAKRLTWFLAH